MDCRRQKGNHSPGVKENKAVFCYDVGGLRIRPLDQESTITSDIGTAFSLSGCYVSDYDATLWGVVQEDNQYFRAMPSFVQKRLEDAVGKDPLLFKGPEGELVVLARGDQSSSYTVCRPPYDQIELYCQKLSDRPAPLLFQAVLLPMISELLVMKGRMLMHAGCVATPEGEGILLIADSGGGKTTTTLAMATSGFHYISDDLVVVSSGEKDLVFEPVREKMNLTRRTIGFFPETMYLRKALEKTPEKKLPVAPADVFASDRIADSAHAAAIFLLRVGSRGPDLLPASANAMMEPMLKNSHFALPDKISKEKIELLWQLLDQASCFALETGPDPDRLGRWLRQEAAAGRFCRASEALKPLKANENASVIRRQTGAQKNRFVPWSYKGLKLFLKGLLAYSLEDRLENTGYLAHFFSRVDPKTFQKWLRFHRIESHVAAYAVAQSIPSKHNSVQAEAFLTQARAYAIQLAGIAGRIFKELRDQNIPALMLRGPAIAEAYFPDASLRYCRDVDVIVRPSDLDRAEVVLQGLGFQPREDRYYWLRKGELPMTDGRVVVELHWGVYPAAAPMPMPEATAWNGTDTVLLDGVSVTMAAPEHLLLSSCVHMACEHGMDRIVRLIDIRQILHHSDPGLDWDWILQKTLEAHMRFPVGHVLSSARDLVDAPVPPDVLKKLIPETFMEKTALAVMSPRRLLMQPDSVSGLRRTIYRRFVRRLIT